MNPPKNTDEARALARHYVAYLASRGYTADQAKTEAFSGMSGPGEPGYLIRSGKIAVPGLSPQWTFDFADLEKSLAEPEQIALL